MDSSDRADWYLVQLKPNSYKLAERNLHRQGFETFLPMLETTTRRADRFVTSVKPLFPGYMFVSFETASAPWRKINSTLGVSRIVTFSDVPKAVPYGLIKALKEKSEKNDASETVLKFSKGDTVLVNSGPFAEFITKIESIDAQQRIWVLMEIMGRETRVQIAPDQLSEVGQ